MFGLFAKKLTEACDYLIDWSRVGELLRGNHHYSRQELQVRGAIIATVAVSGFLAVELNDKQNPRFSNITVAMAGSLLGFVFAHGIAIGPLVIKRLQRRYTCYYLAQECQKAVMEKLSQSEKLTAKTDVIIELTKALLNCRLVEDGKRKEAGASQTWGMRQRYLQCLKDCIAQCNHAEQLSDFLDRDITIIIQRLDFMMSVDEPKPRVNRFI